ncbi:MAG TPA: hypothetical protein VGS57_02590 [Thermoanaerobaculia bacterium]|jgi:hypothetical protein|nr:hypothetical protein [Thermoanaerobaculia bacterium]
MRRRLAALLLLVAASAAPALAVPLALAWGVVGEPAVEGALTPGRVAEHLEFLQAHGWQAIRLRDLAAGDAAAPTVVLSFDDPASAARYVLPLLELYREPAVVTVGAAQGRDPALAPTLALLAHSPWIELVPRVDAAADALAPRPLSCGSPTTATASEEAALSALRAGLAAQLDRLREVTGVAPAAVAWAPGTWSGPAEAVAASLGLSIDLPTFTTIPPQLAPPRVARYAMPAWAGVWADAQAGARWDPDQHPVRFVEVDAAWLCAGGDPEARLRRVVDVVRRLALNGVRIRPGDGSGAWFPTTAAPMRGNVVGALARALRGAGVSALAVDVPATGDPGRDVALAGDLARAVDLDVAVLPAGAREGERLGEAILYARPAARLAWAPAAAPPARGFRLAPLAPEQRESRGTTVAAAGVRGADREATDLAIAGWEWIGLPIELAEAGLRGSLESLDAFALPMAGKQTDP